MLIAYLDEFGHIGPYVSKDHPRHKTHPAFGYAGFVLPVDSVRSFGGFFEFTKEKLLGPEIERAKAHPRRWEKKGSALLTTRNHKNYGSEISPALRRLHARLRQDGGHPVYFGQVKPVGESDAIAETPADRSGHMLINAVRYLASYADKQDERIMIFMDAVDDSPRLEAVQRIGGFIYKASEPALKRVVEVPMQLESKHYGNVQFADWIAAIVTRASDYHLVPGSDFSWAPKIFRSTIGAARCGVGSFLNSSHLTADSRRLGNRDLCDDTAWISRPPVPPRSGKKGSARIPRSPKFTQSIGESVPGLEAFYDSLRAQS
ncbi:DUF3800 domain-containing protein [Microbacterium maritypicum]|uniref:DUF3800 domain-containing protein n=1 Tax=Microbacterium maritypicum TaxID=33918 RepID=UPI003D700B2A